MVAATAAPAHVTAARRGSAMDVRRSRLAPIATRHTAVVSAGRPAAAPATVR